MDVSLIRKLAPGQMPRASEWNAMVDHVQRLSQRDSSKFHAESLPRTRFYTAEEIPPYSLFPVLAETEEKESGSDTFRTVYHVEKYDSSNESSYLEGYFATNGRYTIPKDTCFYGYIIDETHDWPIRIGTSDPSMTKCGFLSGSFIADPDSIGLIVGGATPFGPDIFFVRKALQIGESELFGKLENDWGLEDEEQKIILLEGYSHDGEDYMLAWPAPVLTKSLSAGTVVNLRYVEQTGKWFFFARTEGSVSYKVTASGTALGGFGIQDGKTIWACTLAAGSVPVNVYSTPAVEEQKSAYFFDGKEVWIEFPTVMTDFYGKTFGREYQVARVVGKYWWNPNESRIYLKEDFGTVYQRNGVKFHQTFQYLNSYDVWKSTDGTFLYYDRKYWVISSMFGYVVADAETETQPFSTSISDLVQEFEKPYWSCDEEFGIYKPQNGASGEIQLGSECWTGPEGSEFLQMPELDDNGEFQYSGSVITDEKTFSGIHLEDGVWILGTKDSSSGWYESEIFSKDSSPAVFHFRHESETAEDIQLTFQGYAAGSFTCPVLMVQPGIMT